MWELLISYLRDCLGCPFCTEVLSDPRMLPCEHVFCLRCLMRTGQGKLPGESMPCPRCREEFKLPDVGIEGIPKKTVRGVSRGILSLFGSHRSKFKVWCVSRRRGRSHGYYVLCGMWSRHLWGRVSDCTRKDHPSKIITCTIWIIKNWSNSKND